MLTPSPKLMEKPSVSDTSPMPTVQIAAAIRVFAGGRRQETTHQINGTVKQ